MAGDPSYTTAEGYLAYQAVSNYRSGNFWHQLTSLPGHIESWIKSQACADFITFLKESL